MAKVLITGLSGTGKTTVAKELEKRGIAAFSVDEMEDMCWWVRRDNGEVFEGDIVDFTLDFFNEHLYVCRMDVIKDILEKHEDVAIFGYWGDINDHLHWFDKVIFLTCKPETFLARINQREDNDFGKGKDMQEWLVNWQPQYEKELLEKGAMPINTEKPVEEIVEQVIQEIKG